jgi:hypothetical protein
MIDTKEIVTEGLRPSDLKNFVRPMIEIDSYKSKMGEDRDVCVVNFHVLDRMPARDLMEFIEKGFNFVLDADVSAGENSKGEYHVFVEIDRTKMLPKQIDDLLYGVNKLTDIDGWKFRYYKNKNTYDVTESNIKSIVPLTPGLYEDTMNRFKVENIKTFFNKTLMDDLSLEENVVVIHKPFNQQIKLRLVDENEENEITETAPAVDSNSTAEIFWMTKVLGDYDISKYGDRFVFTNGDRTMTFKRIS